MSELHLVQQLIGRERLSLDLCARGRTCFLSHIGAAPRLVPGAWIGHRDLIYALALANLAPQQRTALARAVLVEHGREFGVGRLVLNTLASGLPLGGSSLRLQPRGNGPVCLYTWALGEAATAAPCEWLLLRAEPTWAQDDPPRPLAAAALETLHALDASVTVLVATAADARQIADRCLTKVPFTAHPRFLPHLEGADHRARIRVWPHDAVDAPGFWPAATSETGAVILVDAPEPVRRQVEAWHGNHPETRRIELARAGCPGRLGRAALADLWRRCEQPQILLRGDPEWASDARRFLHELGARVEAQAQGTQLPLL
ncbi:MAG: hypothetical protein H0T76_15090 [Nannocystis sp.]|nr:hypothetical protein [Nannocystis sp.]MBA3547806.1 hypothetical protein [Nannocystis sp.]